MMKTHLFIFFLLLIFFSNSIYHVREKLLQATEVVPFSTAFSNVVYASTQEASTTGPICGNGVVETGEQCDTGGSRGACPVNCSALCTTNSCGGGGRGGGGIISLPSPASDQARSVVNFNGRAYPKSTVTILKDAQIAATTVADANAHFAVSVGGLSGGNYIFSVYGEDSKGVRSSLLTFPVGVTSGASANIGGIFITPTITVDKSEVKKGDNIAIFGQSTPKAEITISINSEEEFFGKVSSDANGTYLYNFDTSFLELGQHYTKSKVVAAGAISSFSKAVGFIVGNKTILAEEKKVIEKGDLNNDKRVNIVDFSIIAFWYNKSTPPATSDLNSDGKVNLIDFSILAFNWTG